MSRIGFLVSASTGASTGEFFRENELPSMVPADKHLITVEPSNQKYNLIRAFFLGDPEKLTMNYLPPQNGGIVFNRSNNEITFVHQDYSINIEEFRNTRNYFLSITDKYMLLPDLPQNKKTELLAYRETMRNITNKVGNEWKTIHDINWPPLPSFITGAN